MTASAASSRRRVGFGGHQLAEYCLAAAVAVVGLHLSGRSELVLVTAGGVLGASALVSKGPLAAWRIVPRRLHLYVDLLLAGCFALSPLVYLPGLPVIPIVISEAVAFVLVRMSLTTEIVPRPRPESSGKDTWARKAGRLAASRPQAASSASSRSQSPVQSTARPADGSVGPAAASSRPPRENGQDAVTAAAATAGRLFGTAVAKARDSGAPLAAARGLGRATGHARRIGRAAAATKTASSAPSSTAPEPTSSQPAE